jgi:hypothetical protein
VFGQILIVIGLLLNLLGSYKLYKSIIPRGGFWGKDGSNEALPNAVINIDIAKKGFKCIFVGIILQIIAIATFINCDIIIQTLKNLCLKMCE